MSGSVRSGGCQCGRVRYRAEVDTEIVYLCHCRMCQRATGGVSVAYAGIPVEKLTWESDPDWFASSPIAKRPFCSICGTPLGFCHNDGDYIDITVGTLDDPGGLKPLFHFAIETMHEDWLDTTQLQRKRFDENEGLMQAWIDATGKVPK